MQRHRLNLANGRIVHKFWINIEEHRHVHRLTRLQPLLLKAKALDLAEIRRNIPRRDGVRRHANQILGALILRLVERQSRLAWPDIN